MSMSIAAVGAPADLGIISGASGNMPPNQKMTSLFDSINTSGSGSINQTQFNQAFQTLNPPAVFKAQGADAIWSSLDPNGTGNVSKQDFVNTMKDLMVQLRADPTGAASQSLQAKLWTPACNPSIFWLEIGAALREHTGAYYGARAIGS